MKLYKPPLCALLLVIVLTLLWATPGRTEGERAIFPELFPSSDLTATDVVRIQLNALANNDVPHPDAGIEITFRFASPGNREQTGPLPRFIKLVKNPVYRPMVNHRKAELGNPVPREGRMFIPVLLTAADGARAAYVFIVGPQEVEGCAGCWMTESVFRISIDDPSLGV